MKVAYEILTITLLVLSINSISCHAEEERSEVFEKNENSLKDTNNAQCLNEQEIRNTYIYDAAVEDIIQCQSGITNMTDFFALYKALYKSKLLSAIKQCRERHNNFASYLKCSLDFVIHDLSQIMYENKLNPLELELCVHYVLSNKQPSLDESTAKLHSCLGWNTTVEPVQPTTEEST